jgi:hypothetical protein
VICQGCKWVMGVHLGIYDGSASLCTIKKH